MRFSRSPSYLVKHKHIFYVRVSVPQDLRPKLDRTNTVTHSEQLSYG